MGIVNSSRAIISIPLPVSYDSDFDCSENVSFFNLYRNNMSAGVVRVFPARRAGEEEGEKNRQRKNKLTGMINVTSHFRLGIGRHMRRRIEFRQVTQFSRSQNRVGVVPPVIGNQFRRPTGSTWRRRRYFDH